MFQYTVDLCWEQYYYTSLRDGLNNGHGKSLPVSSFLCYIPLSVASQAPSFEYPLPPPEPPSLQPAAPPPVKHNMNTLVSH